MGDGILAQMSEDLKTEFPDMKGFSVRNLKYMRQWFQFWSSDSAIGQQVVAQIPWGHNLTIVAKIKNTDEAMFYVQKTIGVSTRSRSSCRRSFDRRCRVLRRSRRSWVSFKRLAFATV
jgi:predicted nuclease of restriction endonuclease-like (RecB) superfamily